MIRPLLALALFLVPATSSAADRSYSIGSFDRIRVDGPFEVRVGIGSPGAKVSGDARSIDNIDVRIDGTTLVVRMGQNGWGEQPRGSADTPPLVTLTTPGLTSASVLGGGRLTIGRMKGQQVALTVTGGGTLALTTADTDQLNATVIGTGTMSIGGRAARARVVTNGPGAIDASALTVNDLIVRLDGVGEIRASARYTAQVTNTGLGQITIAGNAKCTVKALAGGPVSCGPKL